MFFGLKAFQQQVSNCSVFSKKLCFVGFEVLSWRNYQKGMLIKANYLPKLWTYWILCVTWQELQRTTVPIVLSTSFFIPMHRNRIPECRLINKNGTYEIWKYNGTTRCLPNQYFLVYRVVKNVIKPITK